MKKRITIAIAMVCALLGFSATVWPQSPVQAQNTVSAPQISYERAMELALERVGGGMIWDIELERQRGELIYEVEVRFNGIEYDVYINAATEEIIRFREDGRYNVNSASAMPPCLTEAEITFERAKAIALERAGGGTVTDIELERRRGRLVYEVEVKINRQEYDVRIDAATGEILRFRLDD